MQQFCGYFILFFVIWDVVLYVETINQLYLEIKKRIAKIRSFCGRWGRDNHKVNTIIHKSQKIEKLHI